VKRVGTVTFVVAMCALLVAGIAAPMAQLRKQKQNNKTMAASAMSTDGVKPKPKRLNQAIELLAEGQPIYYTGSHSGTAGTYEQGLKDSQTYADYISYDMEHAPFDVKGLQDYMRPGGRGSGPERPSYTSRRRKRSGQRVGLCRCSCERLDV
jgi:hypothetical protein